MDWEEKMHTIERKDENKLKQKLPIPTSQDNGIKRDAIVIVHIRIKLLEKVEKNNPIIGLNVFYVKKNEYLLCLHFKSQLKSWKPNQPFNDFKQRTAITCSKKYYPHYYEEWHLKKLVIFIVWIVSVRIE